MALPLDSLVVARAGGGPALEWAAALVARLGAAVVAWPAPADAVLASRPVDVAAGRPMVALSSEPEPEAWATSGLMALTGPAGGPPVLPPGPIATRLRGAAGVVSLLSQLGGGPPLELDGAALAAERAAAAGLHRRGRRSVGGSCRLLPAADGWVAVNLARPEDIDLLPAWLGLDAPAAPADPWAALAPRVGAARAGELAERARVLGLPVAALPEPGAVDEQLAARNQAGLMAPFLLDGVVPQGSTEQTPRPGWFRAAPLARMVVADLTSLWAGPLCAHLLGRAGATVVTIESRTRPDGARRGPQGFFERLHAGHRRQTVDLADPADLASLRAQLATADVVLEGSRPRALDHLGIERRPTMDRGGTWVSITGYGRTGPWRQAVAFGDDAAVAAGCVASDDDGGPWFCADALADPAAGLHAAVAALACAIGGGGHLVDVALREAAGALLAPGAASGARGVRGSHLGMSDSPFDMNAGYAPSDDDERTYSSVPLETEDGERVVQQQATGADEIEGGGEFPADPRPPQEPAPGAVAEEPDAST